MEKQGKIKLEFVRRVTPDLLDLEVYLLEERKQHILEHHPEAKELLILIPEVIEEPDFTQRNRNPYTVRFYKFYQELVVSGRTLHNKYLMCPVRLNVDQPPGYKNSIITLHLLSDVRRGEIIWQAS